MMKFPYSQPVRMLNVKSSSNLSKKEFQQRLALAAFYTTDRNVLRSLIEKGKVPSDVGAKLVQPIKKPTDPVKEGRKTKINVQASEAVIAGSKPIKDIEHLRAEVLANLEILQQTKSAFLKAANIDIPTKKAIKKTAPKKTKTLKKVKQKVATKPAVAASTTKTKKISKSPRAKKNELIDKFIADKPSITQSKAVKANQSDLSKASSELKEDLVSENLAIIFANQGKAGKAIEIYKKLIWKFPQKKASFAARIEELKKK